VVDDCDDVEGRLAVMYSGHGYGSRDRGISAVL